MISYYSTSLIPFLTFKQHSVPRHLKRLYYLSFEDALWDVLPQLAIPRGSTIMVPDFYCADVVDNIRSHGYRVSFYPLDLNFQINQSEFDLLVKDVNPSVIIIFHASGITNLATQNLAYLNNLYSHSLIIEDCVHKTLNPSQLGTLHPHHLIIDSLRKNCPLPGSFLYTSSDSSLTPPSWPNLGYVILVSLYYLYYRLCLNLGTTLHFAPLVKYAHLTALKRHDDLVGDSLPGHAGLPVIPWIHSHLNFTKLQERKTSQVEYYLTALTPLVRLHPELSIPAITKDDFGQLHAFPLVAQLPLAQAISLALTPLNVWSKFPDAPWSQHKQVLYLPLGFHITHVDQDQIIDRILTTCQTTR